MGRNKRQRGLNIYLVVLFPWRHDAVGSRKHQTESSVERQLPVGDVYSPKLRISNLSNMHSHIQAQYWQVKSEYSVLIWRFTNVQDLFGFYLFKKKSHIMSL